MAFDFKEWVRQPTTIHGIGAVALGVVGYVAHAYGASNDVTAAAGIAAYALAHFGINDNSTSRGIEKLLEDAATAYVSKSVSAALPGLMTDAQNIAVSISASATNGVTTNA